MPMTTPVNILPLENKEQWGLTPVNPETNSQTIILPLPFSNINYRIVSSYHLDSRIDYVYGFNQCYPISNKEFHCWNGRNNTATQWLAAGF